MCLLHYLSTNADEFGIEVIAAHFDHQLRGAESARDRSFVKKWCEDRSIPCEIGFGKVKEYAKENSLGTEEAARILRYEFLESVASKLACNRIATAHNADDNAETVLFNITRGTGISGVSGIPPVRGIIIRPLLGVRRDEIEKYLEQHGIEHIEDSSNASDDYSRNVIRHNVMPVLKGINWTFSNNVLRLSELSREDDKCLNDMAQDFCDRYVENGEVEVKRLEKLPYSIRSRVVRKLTNRALSKEHVDSVLKLLDGEGVGYCDVPGMRITRDSGKLMFGVREIPLIEAVEIEPGKTNVLNEQGLKICTEIVENIKEINKSFSFLCFKYDKICDRILCTSRMNGDKVRLAGRGCTKSLKDLFSEKGMNQNQRNSTPVFRCGDEIMGVYGFGVSEKYAAKIGDKVLIIKIEELESNENA